MIKQVKRFWDAFGDKDFFGKFVLPSLAIFFTLGTFAQYYCSNLDKEDLIKTTGTIEGIDEIVEYGVRLNKYRPLMIFVTGKETPFRVKDNFKYRFGSFK